MDFEVWLSQRLLELKTDAAVFGPYIKSILGDEDQDEKIEGLDGLLSELGVRTTFIQHLEDKDPMSNVG